MADNPIAQVVNTATTVVNDVSKAQSIGKTVGIVILIAGIVFGVLKLKGCNILPDLKILPTKITDTDTSKPVIESPNRVTYTPKATKDNPHPTPTTVPKPLEGKVKNVNGIITIQNAGFCLIPKLGAVFIPALDRDKQFEGVGGVRFFFAGSFGSEVLTSDKRIFLGVDVRDPILNLLTTSVGATSDYGDLFKPTIYVGEAATLAIF